VKPLTRVRSSYPTRVVRYSRTSHVWRARSYVALGVRARLHWWHHGVFISPRERRKLRHGKHRSVTRGLGRGATVFTPRASRHRLKCGSVSHFANHPTAEPNPTHPYHARLCSVRSETNLRACQVAKKAPSSHAVVSRAWLSFQGTPLPRPPASRPSSPPTRNALRQRVTRLRNSRRFGNSEVDFSPDTFLGLIRRTKNGHQQAPTRG